jgi:hypothetical protein
MPRVAFAAGGRCAEWVDQNITEIFLKELEEQEYANSLTPAFSTS